MTAHPPLREEIVLIDKPIGLTSHDVVDRVRKITGERRVGHASTLDPLATGLLIILVGRGATRRQAEFMGKSKEYQAEVTFGSVSETYDAEGPIKQTATPEELQTITEQSVLDALPQFIGEIEQRPPAHSAIKVGGQALYKKARQGAVQAEDIPPRQVTIDDISIDQFVAATSSLPPTVHLTIKCQKGVYIRSLASDLGQALGVGAYLSALKRTAIGDHRLTDALTLEEFAQQ